MIKSNLFIITLLVLYSCKAQFNLVSNYKEFDLSNKKLTLKKANKKLSKIKNIKVLNLRDNALNRIPEAVFELKDIEILDLSNNKIDSLYANIYKLKNLRTLYLSGNKLEYVSPEVKKMKKLRTVILIGLYTDEERRKFRAQFCYRVKLVFYRDLPNPYGLAACINQ